MRDDRVQAVRVRHHDAAVHRLRDRGSPARRRAPTTSRDIVCEVARGHRAPARGSRWRRSTGRRRRMRRSSARRSAWPSDSSIGKAGLAQFTEARIARSRGAGAGRRRSGTRSIRETSIRATSPATCARRWRTAPRASSGSRTCAAARMRRCSPRNWKPSSWTTRIYGGLDGGRRASGSCGLARDRSSARCRRST